MAADPGAARKREVEAFLQGDPAFLGAIEKAVLATVRSFRFGHADLDRDLVQETLSRTLASLTSERFLGEASLLTYARTIARYTCLEHIRRRRQEVALDPDACGADARGGAQPEASLLSVEEHRRNLAAFASLSSECQQLLRLICLEGCSYREVAERLGISEASLKSRIHRCRLTCREAAKAARRPSRAALGRAWS
jgi:RNA polymerase sigma factor (sigma-70 family)